MNSVFLRAALMTCSFMSISSCSPTPQQINFVVKLPEENSGDLVEILESVADRNHLRFKTTAFEYGDSRSVLTGYMLYNITETVMVQNRLVECDTESKFTPCFSKSDYTVSIYRSSFIQPTVPLACVGIDIASEVRKRRGAAVGDVEAKSGASLSCPR